MLRNNPFQLVGLLASASERERQHQASRIRAFIEIGKPLMFEGEILFHGCRRNSTSVRRALKELQDEGVRLSRGLFWFTDGGIVDDRLLELIAAQDWKALQSLTTKVLEKEALGKGYLSTVSNHATLALFIATSMKPGSFKPALSAGKWRSRKQALLDGLKWKARVVAHGDEDALVGLYGRVADDVLVTSRADIMAAFLSGVEEVVAEAGKLGVSVSWGEVVSVLREAGVRPDALEQRLISSIRLEMEALIRDVGRVNSRMENSKAIDELVQLQKAALHLLHRIAEVSGPDGLQFQSESSKVADALFSKSVEHWSEFDEEHYHVLYSDRKRLEGFRELLTALRQMVSSSPLAMRIEEGLNVVMHVLSELDELERLEAEQKRLEAEQKKKEKEAEARRKREAERRKRKREEERKRKERRDEAIRQSRKEAERERRDRARQKEEEEEKERARQWKLKREETLKKKRAEEAKRQGALASTRARLERDAPDVVPEWYIEWLMEFEMLKDKPIGARYRHLERSFSIRYGASVMDRLWAWGREREEGDSSFNLAEVLAWCGKEYAERVVTLLQLLWEEAFPNEAALRVMTEKVRAQFGRRMVRSLPRVIGIEASLIGRLDALVPKKREPEREPQLEPKRARREVPWDGFFLILVVLYILAALYRKLS